jgi:hypothetical protein
MKQNLNPAVAKALRRLHIPLDVILLLVRWCVAYPPSPRLGGGRYGSSPFWPLSRDVTKPYPLHVALHNFF